MMRERGTWAVVTAAAALIGLLGGAGCGGGQRAAPADDAVAAAVRQEFDLGGPRSPGEGQYQMVTKVVTFADDGTRIRRDAYRVRLRRTLAPAAGGGPGEERCTCEEVTVQVAGGPELRVPALAGWSYAYDPGPEGVDAAGQVLGIDHSKFQDLTDENGAPLPPDVAYAVFNTFVDFHSFCDVLARPVHGDAGIQDLRRVGQRIVHAAAFSEPPVNLGEAVAEGSTFKNGEVTLQMKGLSEVDGAPCALVGFDSGDSSFQMTLQPMPGVEVRTVGGSHYWGDLYVDLASRWVRKATMGELVVVRVTMGGQEVTHAAIERAVELRLVGE